MAKKIGLPDFVRTKHDLHLVEEIATRTKTPVVRNIVLEKIQPGDSQPRKDFKDLDELAESIRQKGILQPILVKARNGGFEIIAGERRFRAAQKLGLSEIPCIEHDVPENEALEISLIENIQRQELNAFEEAIALQTLAEIYGYTHQEIAEKIGKSRVSVSELIRLTDIPEEITNRCLEMGINSKSFLLQLAKVQEIKEMAGILDAYSENKISRDTVKKHRTEKLPLPITGKKTSKFKFCSEDKSIQIRFQVSKERFDKQNLIELLERLIEDVKQDRLKDIPF